MIKDETILDKYSMYTKPQQRAIVSDASTVLVSASAGSGKTTVMIERILRLIEQGASLNQMVICTFTKSAASDMRLKLLNKLTKRAKNGEETAIKALKQLPSAEISTIHSWCNKIIKTYFYMANVDPSIELMDELAHDVMLSSCVDEVVDSHIMADRDDFRKLHAVLTSSRNDIALRDIIADLYNYAVIRSGSKQWIESIKNEESSHEENLKFIAQFYDALRFEILRSLKNVLCECEMAKFDKGIKSVNLTISQVQDWLPLTTLSAKASSAEQTAIVEEKYKPLRARYKKLADEYTSAINSLDPSVSKIDKEILAQLALEVYERFSALKLKKGLVDFSDLEHLTHKILSQKSAQELLKNKYKYLFVDEYQDINLLQDEIFSLLDLNRFYVGDIKQSIYAFRLCDPKIFADKIEHCRKTGDGEVIILDANFRSDCDILSFCDSVFCDCMTKDFGQVDYATEGKFISGRGKLFPQSVVCKTFDAKEVKNFNNEKGVDDGYADSESEIGGVYSVRDHQYIDDKKANDCKANLIVDHILELLQTKFFDSELGQERYVKHSDIAILSRGVENAFITTLIKKMNLASIPIAINKKRSTKNNIIVNLLVDYLSLVNNSHNDIALAGVMKSCLGYFMSDSDLLNIRAMTNDKIDYNKSFVDAVKAYKSFYDDELAQKIKKLFEDINGYKKLSDVLKASELAGKICAEHGLFKYALSLPDGERMGMELHEFLAKLSVLPGGSSLNSVLNDLEKLEINLSSHKEMDGVRIMTIHASKGLEYHL